MQHIPDYIKIPKVFQSVETGEPFSNCLHCDAYLLKPGTSYVIEKAVRRYQEHNTDDVIFEYAICVDCHEKLRQTLSETSRQRVETYFSRYTDLNKRHEALINSGELNIEDWISNCVITGVGMERCDEYQIYCQCDGENMLFAYTPFMISSHAIEEISGLLSQKTIGEIDRFMGQHFDGPPGMEKEWRDKILIF